MHASESLADLPEALPLRRVSPAWRILAVLETLVLIGLVLLVCVLGIALLQRRVQPTVFAAPTMPPATPPMFGLMPPPSVEETDDPNLPYPVVEDLRAPAREREPAGRDTARQRFLARSEEIWQNPKGHFPSVVIVSPDGQALAYPAGNHVMAGPFLEPKLVGSAAETDAAMAGGMGSGRMMMPGVRIPQANSETARVRRVAGAPVWSADGQQVFFATAGGTVWRGGHNSTSDRLPFRGAAPAPVPNDVNAVIVVRSQAGAKADSAGLAAPADRSEVVQINLLDKSSRILLPASSSVWTHLALSPDGTRLALVGDRGVESMQPKQWRVFVMELKENAEPKALTRPAKTIGPVCWTPDGQAVVYARSQNPPPAEFWDEEHAGLFRDVDLFHYDLAAGRETRLSRGGSCYSPSMDRTGNLHFVAWLPDRSTSNVRLKRMPLKEALAFAAREPDPPTRDTAGWAALAEQVMREVKANDTPPTAELMGRLGAAFSTTFRTRFRSEPPTSIEGFDQLRKEVQGLHLSTVTSQQLAIVLAAAEGEFLRQQGRAHWALGKGPLVPSSESSESDSPFGVVIVPFRSLSAVRSEDATRHETSDSLAAIMRKALGRTVVLSNDASAGRAAVEALADADLARGAALLKDGKPEEGVALLLALTKKKGYERNDSLALHVGKLLYDHSRKKPLIDLMAERGGEPFDTRKFNLWGLALLLPKQTKDDPDFSPQDAIEKFRSAIRCDLQFGPAYLNLAEAYRQTNNHSAARSCLLRYLDLMPNGPYATDAQHRLGELLDDRDN